VFVFSGHIEFEETNKRTVAKAESHAKIDKLVFSQIQKVTYDTSNNEATLHFVDEEMEPLVINFIPTVSNTPPLSFIVCVCVCVAWMVCMRYFTQKGEYGEDEDESLDIDLATLGLV